MKPEHKEYSLFQNTKTPAGKKTVFLSVILIILLGFAAYGNSFNNEFVWDDKNLIGNNAYIKDLSHMLSIFSKDLGAGSGKEYNAYRPVQLITYVIDYSLWKLNVRGYHLTNILLHICVALGIYCLINVLFHNNFLSLLTGSFYVVHPIHTEAVTYISGRADSLALLFMLLCALCYSRYPRACPWVSTWRIQTNIFHYYFLFELVCFQKYRGKRPLRGLGWSSFHQFSYSSYPLQCYKQKKPEFVHIF